MGRLAAKLPFWAFFLIAAGFLYLGFMGFQGALEDERAKAVALSKAPPAVVDLSEFRRDANTGTAGEVAVTGWIDTDYNYNLIRRTNGLKTGERFMFVLFGAEDSDGSLDARAAMVLTKAQKDYFVENMFEFIDTVSPAGVVLRLNGRAHRSVGYSSLARDALRKEGLGEAEDFFFLEPFLEGREAGLAPAGVMQMFPMPLLGAAAFAMLIGLVKMTGRRRHGTVASGQAVGAEPDLAMVHAAAPAAGAGAETYQVPGLTEDSPFARMRMRERAAFDAQLAAGHVGGKGAGLPEDGPYKSGAAKRSRGALWKPMLGVGVLLYLGVFVAPLGPLKTHIQDILPGALSGVLAPEAKMNAVDPAPRSTASGDPLPMGPAVGSLVMAQTTDTPIQVDAPTQVSPPPAATPAPRLDAPSQPDARGADQEALPLPADWDAEQAALLGLSDGAGAAAGGGATNAAPGAGLKSALLPVLVVGLTIAVACLALWRLFQALRSGFSGGGRRGRADPFARLAAEARSR
ncbi:MAG: hypothetical protein JXJ18_08785 [Rhodobacteraceae bacterium]|nr:hypothetical protein [Paracoccaceae bacterium]